MMIGIAALALIVQANFMDHVIKNALPPYGWCFIMFSPPVLGCIVYDEALRSV
jgi:hypothetical protein